jgi:hypothetical protein
MVTRWQKFISEAKKQKSELRTILIIAVLTILSYFFVTKYVIEILLVSNAIILQKAFTGIFLNPFDFKFMIAAVTIIAILFFYISIPIYLFFMMGEIKKFKRGVFNGLADAFHRVWKKKGKWFFLILTITLSISLMCTGILFLATAFPAEPLFKGIKGTYSSNLTCYHGSYLNLISTWDVSCTIRLANEFNNKTIDHAEIMYFINRTTNFKENVSWTDKEHISLYYDKIKQPQFLYLYFKNTSEEVFAINFAGVYTKEEYYDREKDKAVWFFGIISMSIFSVFSAMANVKQILEKK